MFSTGTVAIKITCHVALLLCSLVSSPPPFLPSVCIHSNTPERKTGFLPVFCSRVLLLMQMEGKIGEAWERGYF